MLVTISFHSFSLADTQSAGSIGTHIDGTLNSQQSPQQQQQPRQQHASVPSSMFAPIASSYPRSFFQSDEGSALPFPYDVTRDYQEETSGKAKSGLSLEPRGSPRFVGKKDASEFEDSDEHARPSRARSPKFVGKKRVNEEVNSGILSDDHRVEKRSAPRFVGKRASRYAVRGAPFFIGKRYIQNRAANGASNTPYLSAQEFKKTFRRTDPLFMGKRTLDFDEDDYEDKRGAPRFVGKRGAPRFVGKRGAPRFVGKRGAPRFVGKRGAPRFVGKRDMYELDGLFDPRAFSDDAGDDEALSGQYDDANEFLRSLLQNDQNLLASEFLASEMLNAERQGLRGLEDETTEEGDDRR